MMDYDTGKYILEGKKPKHIEDMVEWAEWYEKADRVVAKTELHGMKVSTVFLGLDHSFGNEGPPLLFETMVFQQGDWGDLDMMRYATWEEAEAGHKEMVKRVKRLVKKRKRTL